jgi:hypothetical protein
MPGWLVMLLVAAVVVGIGYVLYMYVLPTSGGSSGLSQDSPFEEVGEATASPGGARIAHHIEVTGFRITEDEQQKATVQFLVINHSAAEIDDLGGTVYLRTVDSADDADPILSFDFKADTIGVYESIEFKTVVKTELRAYEIPDWQFLKPQVVITSPAE